MKILHTADWHLNNRLGRVELQPFINKRLVEIAGYLSDYQIDVMVVAGDIFSRWYMKYEEIEKVMNEVRRIFVDFIAHGGTIIGISGNHDNEALFRSLSVAMDLAAPVRPQIKDNIHPNGRMYLLDRPGILGLIDRAEEQVVQFGLLPYPSWNRYLYDEAANFSSKEEKHQRLKYALEQRLRKIEKELDPRYPTVLVSHIHVRGAQPHQNYEMGEKDDIVFEVGDIPTHWAYQAFGHIHKPQIIQSETMRYAGSIERFELSDGDHEKSVAYLEILGNRVVDLDTLPLNATPIYRIEIDDPEIIPHLPDQYPDCDNALVQYRLNYQPEVHGSLSEIEADLGRIFPYWYAREITEVGELDYNPVFDKEYDRYDLHSTVKDYLSRALNEEDDEKDDILEAVEQLLAELGD